MDIYIYVCVCVCVYNIYTDIYIYYFIITVLAVTNSLGGFVANQVRYNLEIPQYL